MLPLNSSTEVDDAPTIPTHQCTPKRTKYATRSSPRTIQRRCDTLFTACTLDAHTVRREPNAKPQVVQEPTLADLLRMAQEKKDNGPWVPANNGTEKPFITRTHKRLQYVWQPSTGRHAYYDCDNDLILSDEDAQAALAI